MSFQNGAPPPADEGKDLDEVEDVVSEDEFLHEAGHGAAGKADDIVAAQEKDELALSLEELRARHEYYVSLGIGPSKPWQTYSLEFASFVKDDVSFGFYAGAGDRHDKGIIGDQGYDLRVTARSAGVTARYFLTKLERLSLEGNLAYGTWAATLAPHGSDDSVVDDGAKLATSFHGHGPIVGLGAVLSWIWENGFYLEWTPVGARWSKMLSKDFSRDSALGRKAVLRAVEQTAFYGLTNIRLGYLF